jgi:hypothetical protein
LLEACSSFGYGLGFPAYYLLSKEEAEILTLAAWHYDLAQSLKQDSGSSSILSSRPVPSNAIDGPLEFEAVNDSYSSIFSLLASFIMESHQLIQWSFITYCLSAHKLEICECQNQARGFWIEG